MAQLSLAKMLWHASSSSMIHVQSHSFLSLRFWVSMQKTKVIVFEVTYSLTFRLVFENTNAIIEETGFKAMLMWADGSSYFYAHWYTKNMQILLWNDCVKTFDLPCGWKIRVAICTVTQHHMWLSHVNYIEWSIPQSSSKLFSSQAKFRCNCVKLIVRLH